MDMVLQARLKLSLSDTFFCQRQTASARLIKAFDDVEYSVYAAHMRVGTIESAVMFVDGSRLKDAWKIFVGDANTWISLPVFQQNIVSGIIFLDETIL